MAVLGAALLLAAAYIFNLGSLYAPTNGDEMVYLHIARLTAESGHWLPLVSDLQTPTGAEMRNTKPPLLFWQAMWAGQFGWDLWVLRLPYVLQTLFCALLVGYVALAVQRRVGAPPSSRTLAQQSLSVKGSSTSEREWREVTAAPLLAAALFLGFFSTYRYGRPVLPSSTESLFLFAVCALVVTRESVWRRHPVWLALLCGLLMIPALLVKSFVLAAPVGLWLFAALWLSAQQPFGLSLSKASWLKLLTCAWPSTMAVLIGLAGFALWFALDPNPAAVWREFIVGENFSTKFSDAHSDSVLSILFAPLLNAGLLAPLILGLCWVAGKEGWQALRHKTPSMTMPQKQLWLWVTAWLVVFAIPSQRSARYVIPVMPAVAVLVALYADRIHRFWWMLTLGLIALATAALGWIAYALAQVVDYALVYFLAIALVFVLCAVGLVSRRYRTALTASCGVAWLALLGALAAPFDGAAGQFDRAVVQPMAGKTIWVPQNFNAQFERYQFVLKTSPRVQTIPYEASKGLPKNLPKDSLFVTNGCGDCTVLASRWVLRSRHAAGEVTLDKLRTRAGVQALLVEREVLIGTK